MNTELPCFPRTAAQAASIQATAAQQAGRPMTSSLDLGGGVLLPVVLIPPGTFLMGSPPSEDGRYDTEGPLHPVQICHAFYLSQNAVTQAHWQAVMGANPARFQGNLQRPVERVSWDDAVLFCAQVALQTRRPVRLPTEAEWEYACRAGSSTAYAFSTAGDELSGYAWYRDNADGVSHPVGSKQPNAWGVYDMHGGIDEWCQDVWHPSYAGAPTDGSAWMESGDPEWRVLRGGSWYDIARHCRSAHRNHYPRGQAAEDHGPRVVVPLADYRADTGRVDGTVDLIQPWYTARPHTD